jgi:protein-tyrosine phosphatase
VAQRGRFPLDSSRAAAFTVLMDITAVDDDGRLYVSSSIDDWSLIKRLGISVVVDLEGTVDAGIPTANGALLYLYYPFEDEDVPDPQLVSSLSGFLARLYREGHRVLVHCSMGLNRSPLVAGAVMHQLGWSGEAAVDRLRERRPGALFNPTYCDYLRLLGEKRGG